MCRLTVGDVGTRLGINHFKKLLVFFILLFARKTLKDMYKHIYSVIHKITHTFTVNKINN